jgi:uncharacterized membrane protein YidH (DUF202 family)
VSSGREPGPPFDPGLQPERTALAWQRTGLALAAGALAGLRILPSLVGPAAFVFAAGGLALAIAVVVLARKRYRRAHEHLTQGSGAGLPDGGLPALTAFLTVLVGLGALVVALVRH